MYGFCRFLMIVIIFVKGHCHRINIMKKKVFFAVDLGATSGRTIAASLEDGKLMLNEISRFPNHIIELQGHAYWDLPALYMEIIAGLRDAGLKGYEITSIGIDTWGVDVAFFGSDGGLLRNPYCYRDTHTADAPEQFFSRFDSSKVYEITGIQVMNFNTLFQLDTLRRNNCPALEAAGKILFIPDALSYMLTGKAVTERTIASTSQMADARSGEFDAGILDAIGVDGSLFSPMVDPGYCIGMLSPEVRRLTGLGAIPVIAVAGHDTASAVAAVPAADADFAYLSSGTWSLMGIEADAPIISDKSRELNFTNEGGVDRTVRFLKNICGMWLLECCRREWSAAGIDTSYVDLCVQAEKAERFRSLVNPDNPRFANPESMLAEIADYCRETGQPVPETQGEYTLCILESLALRYRQVMSNLRDLAPHEIKCLHIIGGGSRNSLLNQMTADAIGMPVVAGPSEATAIGNALMQARAAGVVGSLQEMRHIVSESTDTLRFEPSPGNEWDEAYMRYNNLQ